MVGNFKYFYKSEVSTTFSLSQKFQLNPTLSERDVKCFGLHTVYKLN